MWRLSRNPRPKLLFCAGSQAEACATILPNPTAWASDPSDGPAVYAEACATILPNPTARVLILVTAAVYAKGRPPNLKRAAGDSMGCLARFETLCFVHGCVRGG